jgi:hypothetical protein
LQGRSRQHFAVSFSISFGGGQTARPGNLVVTGPKSHQAAVDGLRNLPELHELAQFQSSARSRALCMIEVANCYPGRFAVVMPLVYRDVAATIASLQGVYGNLC